MKFTKKQSRNKYFNVCDYNEEQRQFFIDLGFTERTYKDFEGNVMKELSSLNFHGSGIFGFWSDEEKKEIFNKTEQKYGKVKVRTLTIQELM